MNKMVYYVINFLLNKNNCMMKRVFMNLVVARTAFVLEKEEMAKWING